MGCDGKVKDSITSGVVLLDSSFVEIIEPSVSIRLGWVAGEMDDAALDELPSPLVERFGCWPGSRIRDEISDPFGQIFTKRFDRFRRAVDGNDSEPLRKQLCLAKL